MGLSRRQYLKVSALALWALGPRALCLVLLRRVES